MSYAYPPAQATTLYPPTLPPAYAPAYQQAYPSVYPSAPPPDEYYIHNCPDQLPAETLGQLIEKNSIASSLAQMLYVLKKFDIVILCDDSGSMTNMCTSIDEHGNTVTQSRWKEAERIVKTILQFALAIDDNGVDLFFFGAPTHVNIKNVQEIERRFSIVPNQSTPMVATVEHIFNEFKDKDKDILLIIITDGEPSGGPNESFTNLYHLFKEMIKYPNPKFRVSTVLTTSDEDVVNQYNIIDKQLKFFDVSDDYMSERTEILAKQGPKFKFNFGDYICKILLAPICTKLDKLDEKKMNINTVVKNFTHNYDMYGLYHHSWFCF